MAHLQIGMDRRTLDKAKKPLLVGVFLLLWGLLHIPGIFYGTQDLPLHQSYIGDEQSPVNGALHILQDKNPVGLRNLQTLYYGPVFAVVALPAVVGDYAEKIILGAIKGAEDYKNYILYDWGGIVWKARLISVSTGFLALIALYLLLMTKTVNPRKRRDLAVTGTVLLAGNFFFFEYSSFFKHWVYLLAALLWQLYLLVRIHESPERAKKYFIIQGVIAGLSFGISYLALLSQIIFLPSFMLWVKTRNKDILRDSLWFVGVATVIAVICIIWHPRAFIRILGLVSGDIMSLDTSTFSSESTGEGLSFLYYGKIIVLNHLSLLLALLVLLYVSIKDTFAKGYLIFATTSTTFVFYLMFGVMSHHESRYILPVIVLLVVTTAVLFVRHFIDLKGISQAVVVSSLVFYVAFHGVTIWHWNNLMIEGPMEERAITEAVEYQKKYPESKQLFLAWYLLGYPHTQSAYVDYAVKFNKSDSNLYRVLFVTSPPSDSIPLHVYYIQPNGFPLSSLRSIDFSSYNRVVYGYNPAKELALEPDYLEVDLVRYWVSPELYFNSFKILKE